MDERIAKICEEAIAGRVFPGCQVGFVRDGTASVHAFGRLTYEPDAPTVTDETLYDVASVTKSIPTASLLLKLIEDGRVGLDDPVVRYLPELNNQYRDKILVRHLLTYTVVFDIPGMAALAKADPEHVLDNLMAAPLLAPPGETYLYTNAPAILAGLIAERVSGMKLSEAAQEAFFKPLLMTRTTFDTQHIPAETVAPSEVDDRGEVRGVPHDESAWALAKTGHISGAAGLFSTAGDLLKFAEMLLAGGKNAHGRILSQKTIELMHTNQVKHLGERAGLGWEMGREDIWGDKTSPVAFMKTGFTGCIVYIDPTKKTALVHLSNCSYPSRQDRKPLRHIWRDLAEIIFE